MQEILIGNIRGPKGDTGNGLTIKEFYSTIDELPDNLPKYMQLRQWVDTKENRDNILAYCKELAEKSSKSTSLNERIASAQERQGVDKTPSAKNEKEAER